jgi:hypothetical protein
MGAAEANENGKRLKREGSPASAVFCALLSRDKVMTAVTTERGERIVVYESETAVSGGRKAYLSGISIYREEDGE